LQSTWPQAFKVMIFAFSGFGFVFIVSYVSMHTGHELLEPPPELDEAAGAGVLATAGAGVVVFFELPRGAAAEVVGSAAEDVGSAASFDVLAFVVELVGVVDDPSPEFCWRIRSAFCL